MITSKNNVCLTVKDERGIKSFTKVIYKYLYKFTLLYFIDGCSCFA